MSKIRFTVETVRSGQPRPYADTEREYIVTVERAMEKWAEKDHAEFISAGWYPWLYGKQGNEEWFQKWCDQVVKATCQNFYRVVGKDGADWASPILKWMRTDHERGTIHVFITEAYTD